MHLFGIIYIYSGHRAGQWNIDVYNFEQNCMDYSIIKILDGIFISNSSVMEDYDFLFNNKVSHIVASVAEFPHQDEIVQDFQASGIKLIVFQDPTGESPNKEQLVQCVQAIEESRGEYLCTLIFSDKMADVLPFLVAYLEHRFLWNRQAAITFLEKKLALQGISEFQDHINSLFDFNEGLYRFEESYASLKQIYWNRSFLDGYSPGSSEEKLLINTIKNTLPTEMGDICSETKQKKTKRVTWGDMVPRNSINAGKRLFLNSKISVSLKKSASSQNIVTIVGNFVQKPLLKDEGSNKSLPVCVGTNTRASSAKKSIVTNKLAKQSQMDDFDYLSLKQLSRTNFDDLKMKGSKLKKRNQLLAHKPQQKQSLKRRSYGYQKQNKPLELSTTLLGSSWKGFDPYPRNI